MDILSLKKSLGKDWTGYRETITGALEGDTKLLKDINLYLLGTQGKELRPLLSLLAARLCQQGGEQGGEGLNKSCYSAAAVAELLHTASLLHDDVADNGNVRHGVATIRAIFSPAAAVLSGDYWLSKAMYLLAADCSKEVLVTYAQTVSRLAEGELFQMEKAAALDTTSGDYYKIIEAKTASLFMAAMKGGAVSAGATKFQIASVEEYARQLGLAFQIRDDIFDYTPAIKSGKESGTDIRERKITLPLLLALQKASPEEAEALRSSISRIDYNIAGGAPQEGAYKQMEDEISASTIEFVQRHNGTAEAQVVLERHVEAACLSLDVFPDSWEKQALVDIAQFVGSRNA